MSAHSSVLELGKNAIEKLIIFYDELKLALATITVENPVLGGFVHNTSIIEGGNQINSVPEYAHLIGNIRTIPEFDNEKTEEMFQNLVDKINAADPDSQLTLVVTQSAYPMFSEPDSKIVVIAQEVGKSIIGEDIACIGISGGTDASEFVRVGHPLPTIIFGPGNETPHMTGARSC